MSSIESITDARQMRHYIRELSALSDMLAVWGTLESDKIANGVAALLLSMLDADLVYISFSDDDDRPVVVVHTPRGPAAAKAIAAVRASLVNAVPGDVPGAPDTIPDPFGEGYLRLVSAPIGVNGGAMISVASVHPDFPGEVQRLFLGVAVNEIVTALRGRQAALAEQRFAALIEKSADFIGVASLDGVPQYVNPAGLCLVGLRSLDEVGSAGVLGFVHPDEVRRVRDVLWPTVIREGRWIGEIDFRHFGTGARLPFLVDWFRIDDPHTGKHKNIATVSRDLTQQKKVESELLQLNESLEAKVALRTNALASAKRKLESEIAERERAYVSLNEVKLELFHAARLSVAGQMAATLAHELSQPLTAATCLLNAAHRALAAPDATHAEILETVQEATGQVERASQIIHRLRRVIRGGMPELRHEEVRALLQEAADFAMTGEDALGVTLAFDVDPEVHLVEVDRLQMHQVLANLIRNALQAMSAWSRRELTLSARLGADGRIEVAVQDTGPGITSDVLDRLFEPFFSTRGGGMGLGLTISRSIVEAHGGKLEAHSRSGEGTTFRFTLDSAL